MARNTLIPYRRDLKEKARALRKNSTFSEILLWKRIRNRQLGFQFHRQVPILDYIVDFYCHELQLSIEIDGNSHDEKIIYDKIRQKNLEEFGIKVLRFKDGLVKKDVNFVVVQILEYLNRLNQDKNMTL